MAAEPKQWTQTDLESLIREGVEEHLSLDYKAADALAATEGKKNEIRKDVSAFANSAGGIIIYGIKEWDSSDKKHLPERLDPIDRHSFSKEWLEQVISNIRPRISDVRIVPVAIGASNDSTVAYVVEIPQGRTAHQASDCRYYRRYNFESVPMADHEVRDVMGRRQHPDIDVSFCLVESGRRGIRIRPGSLMLELVYRNVGAIYANYVNGMVLVPALVAGGPPRGADVVRISGRPYVKWRFANIHRDRVLDINSGVPGLAGRSYDVTRYDPLLPGDDPRREQWELDMRSDALVAHGHLAIHWKIYADNMPAKSGIVTVESLCDRGIRTSD